MQRRPKSGRQQCGPFQTTLFRYPGKGGWHFAIVPKTVAPPATRPWGRTPVTATVDHATWDTSIWRDTKSNRSLLAVPKKHRAGKGDGDVVTVTFAFDPDDDLTAAPSAVPPWDQRNVTPTETSTTDWRQFDATEPPRTRRSPIHPCHHVTAGGEGETAASVLVAGADDHPGDTTELNRDARQPSLDVGIGVGHAAARHDEEAGAARCG